MHRNLSGTVDSVFADAAIRESLKSPLETVEVRQKYWKKFWSIPPVIKAARFYQLEKNWTPKSITSSREMLH